MQLEYSEAHKNLQISARKAPQNSATGRISYIMLPVHDCWERGRLALLLERENVLPLCGKI